jgi:hypothetical protein
LFSFKDGGIIENIGFGDDGTIKPLGNTIRAEAAVIIYKSLES